jgi:hypothetical protein
LKRSLNQHFQDDLVLEKEKSNKKLKVHVVIDDVSKKESQTERETMIKTQKEVAYSIDTPPSIFSNFEDMRNKNEQIKELLNQKLNQDALDTRLLSRIDFENGRLNLAILESVGTSIQGQNNYKATNFYLNLDDIPLPDKMGLHNQTGETITRDIMKTTLSLQIWHKLNSQLKQQLKQEKTSSRVNKMSVEDLEKKLVKMRDDATNEEPIQKMVSAKDNEIDILKKKLKLSNVDHVKTPDLLVIQKEKDKLTEIIEKLNEQNISLHQQNQVLKQGIPSSSSGSTLAYSSEDLVKALTDLNAKEIELEELRRKVSTYETKINLLKDHIGEKEKKLKKVQGGKAKLQEEYDTLKGKISGNSHLMGERHLIWDKIIDQINKMWKIFIIMEEEASLVRKVEKEVETA